MRIFLNTVDKLELTKHVTPHANGERLLKWSSSHSHSSQSATILLVVWFANGNDSAFTSKVNTLNDDTYRWDCATVIVSSDQTEHGAH